MSVNWWIYECVCVCGEGGGVLYLYDIIIWTQPITTEHNDSINFVIAGNWLFFFWGGGGGRRGKV